VTIFPRRAGRVSYRVVIVAAAPILLMALANLERTGEAAFAGRREIAVGTKVPAGVGPRPRPAVPDVQPVQLLPIEPAREVVLSRNPFTFAPRSLPPAPAPAPIALPPLPDTPDVPPGPDLSLIGVATTARADGQVERTAIVAGPAGALYMARETDAVAGRYRVEAVTPDSVVLADGATGASLRLVLR